MSSFRSPDLTERRSNATTVKKEMLEKFRAARQEPAFEQRRLKRNAVSKARAARADEREAAKKEQIAAATYDSICFCECRPDTKHWHPCPIRSSN